jgi:hypothetical protein
MDDEQEDDEMVAVDRRDLQVAEAAPQAVLELQAAQEGLQEDEPAVRGPGLLLEAEGGEFVDFAMDRGSQSGGHCQPDSASVGRRPPWIALLVRSSTQMSNPTLTVDLRGDSQTQTVSVMRHEGHVRLRSAGHDFLPLRLCPHTVGDRRFQSTPSLD